METSLLSSRYNKPGLRGTQFENHSAMSYVHLYATFILRNQMQHPVNFVQDVGFSYG
jgi:hypothetical protein